jgi:oligopeptide/dipeptide ABC transporter ATP-binding protein
VGESGSGKSVTALAIAQLIEPPAAVSADRLDFRSSALLMGGSMRQRRLLGTSLAMVFQDPMTSLNPALRVGIQLAEVSMQHEGMPRRLAMDKAVSRLQAVRVQAARLRVRQYPHEFSGGMRQRVMIAMGLMGQPRLIIADEPTTALDVTVQQQVLTLLSEVREREGAAVLLISHDLSVVAQHCERVIVMYAGRIVEDLPVTLLPNASHPYTRALLAAAPDMTTPRDRPLPVIPGRPPEPDQLTVGCPFAPRCDFADTRCHEEEPDLTPLNGDYRIACWHPRLPLPIMQRSTTRGLESTHE